MGRSMIKLRKKQGN